MPKDQCKNKIINSQGNKAPPEPSSPMTTRPEYSSTVAAQGNNLKNNFTKMIEVLKQEMKKKIKEKTNKNLE